MRYTRPQRAHAGTPIARNMSAFVADQDGCADSAVNLESEPGKNNDVGQRGAFDETHLTGKHPGPGSIAWPHLNTPIPRARYYRISRAAV